MIRRLLLVLLATCALVTGMPWAAAPASPGPSVPIGAAASAAGAQGSAASTAGVPGSASAGSALGGTPAHAIPPVVAGPTVFVGVSGLTFEQIDPYLTPHLWSLVEDGAIGTMTPRSVRSTSCPVDGWLAIGSGRRAADEAHRICRDPGEPVESWVPDWAVYRLQAEQDNYDAPLGTLHEAIADVHAIGPGAAIAAAGADGRVDSYAPVSEDLAAQVGESAAEHPLTVLDLGNTQEPGYSLIALDAQIGEVREALAHTPEPGARPADSAPTLIVASISDGWSESSAMQFSAVVGPFHDSGVLTSTSTQQPGLVQTTDILPTLVRHAPAVPERNFAGAPLEETGSDAEAPARYQQMLDRQVAVATQAALSVWFFPVMASILAVLLVVAVLVGRRDMDRVRGPLRGLGLFFAALPVSTYLVNLVPWERSTSPDVAMLAALAGWALALTLLGLLGPWRHRVLGPITVIAAATVLVLAADVIAGSPLQMSTLLGEPLLIASRFYGIGNSALALFCTALVFLLGVVCQAIGNRWVRLTTVLVTTLAACILLATPGLGTKFGSVPTLIIGLAVLALAAAGVRLSIKRLLLITGAAGLVMLLVLVLDWLRPAAQRTHFGRFFDSILSGEAGAVLMRKIGMNIDILTQSWMTLLLPVIIAGVFWLILSPRRVSVPHLPELYRRYPMMRAAMASLAVLLAVGTVINDSGIVVPAVGILFIIPAFAHLVGQAEAEAIRTERSGGRDEH
ncbi:hypothetical protein ACUXNS_000216 [Brevibacterium pityocampae]